MGKYDNSKINDTAHAKTPLVILVLACVCLCACVPNVPASPQEPVPIASPVPTPEPVLENPVAIYWQGYHAEYVPALAALQEAADTNIEYLDYVLCVRRHMQAMQCVLQPLLSLRYTSEELWDGPLVGAVYGTGSVTGNYEEASFACVLYNDGRITGTLKGKYLQGAWEQYHEIDKPLLDEEGNSIGNDGEYRPVITVELRETVAGWFASVNEEGAYSALYISQGRLYFAEEMEAPVLSYSFPEDWADWYFENGRCYGITHEESEGEGEYAG